MRIQVSNLTNRPLSTDIGLLSPASTVSVDVTPDQGYFIIQSLQILIDRGLISYSVFDESENQITDVLNSTDHVVVSAPNGIQVDAGPLTITESSADISADNTGRIRFNSNHLEVSEDGEAYTRIGLFNYGTTFPTTGTWARGAIVFNTQPSAGGSVGWICVTGGTPGTWREFGLISS